ncbi:MotE family protein [Pararhodobacter sp.]|uniref:MotE family protein n=1 Tax=Pararhodobacter sp. TaxID=2127056 RepID=UPI002AFDD7F3|nr:hypothetical protein [Pararhodobacter sp.]
MPAANPAKRKPRARVLPVLAILFAFGASLRVVSGLDAAFAQDPEPVMRNSTPDAIQSTEPATVPLSAHANSPQSGADLDTSAEILVDLHRREVALRDRESDLNEREVLIAAAQDRLQAQIDALQNAEQELAATMALADSAAEEDINRLVSVYQAMGSEQAAAVFSEMAPEFAAGFLGRLTPEAAAAILAGLEPRQAYGLSAILAGRNALVPRN